MELQVQILSLIVSGIFGFLFSFLVNLHYHILFSSKKWFRRLMNFLFTSDMALLYFLVLKTINGGIIHYYFYLLACLGFLLGYPKSKGLRKLFLRVRKHK